MAPIVDCPSCGRKLRIAESLQDQKVRCPTCGTVFEAAAAVSRSAAEPETAPAAAASVPVPKLSAPAEPPPPSLPRASGYGFVEVGEEKSEPLPSSRREPSPTPAVGDLRRCPLCGEDTPRRLALCRACGKQMPDEDDYRPWEDAPGRTQRLDCEPHRASTVLTVGILSLVVPLAGFAFGVAGWFMGQKDLGKMNRKEMDVAGRSTTQAGWICSIIGTILNLLLLIGCGGCFGLMVWGSNNATANKKTYTPPPATVTVPTGATRR